MTMQKQLWELPSLRAYSDGLDDRYMGTSSLRFASNFDNREVQDWALCRIAELLGWDTESGFCFYRQQIGRYSLWRIEGAGRTTVFGADSGIDDLMEMKRNDAIAAILICLENKKSFGETK